MVHMQKHMNTKKRHQRTEGQDTLFSWKDYQEISRVQTHIPLRKQPKIMLSLIQTATKNRGNNREIYDLLAYDFKLPSTTARHWE